MSVVKISNFGWFISHKTLVKEIYANIDSSGTCFELKPELFQINVPYKSLKASKCKRTENDSFHEEVQRVEKMYKLMYNEIKEIFLAPRLEVKNTEAVSVANKVYDESGTNLITDLIGANPDDACVKTLNKSNYLFPQNCKFFSKDTTDLSEHLKTEKFDLILLDPPWWNKYIRRKRKHTEHGYDMMYNEQLKQLPIENHLSPNALVVVWCTNSPQHFKALHDEFFPKWGVTFLGKWYWVKVTESGEPVCQFSQPPRKQPFEQIIVGCVNTRHNNPPVDKLVISVPSALHSHKPPLMRLLEPFLPPHPACLEIFARYLLPNWTSYGNEVLRLQHESLYKKTCK